MPNEHPSLKVFLCHADSDKNAVRDLYRRLTRDGLDAWLDKEKLLPGQDWEHEIRRAVRESDVVVVCLSKEFNQAGFRQKEVRLALDTAMEKPEGEIFIIPARLEECDVPESLRRLHWVDLFEAEGYERLFVVLQQTAKKIGATLHAKQPGGGFGRTQSRADKNISRLEREVTKPRPARNWLPYLIVPGALVLLFGAYRAFSPLIVPPESTRTPTNRPAVTQTVETGTPSPTDTPIPTATVTLTITPSASPTPDMRVIDIDPWKLRVQKDKLPPSGRYYVPSEGWIDSFTNAEVVSSWTVEEGRAYLAETGRIHGWLVSYKRGANGVVMPEEVSDNVSLYSNVAGAQLVVTKYGARGLADKHYNEVEAPLIGDVARAFRITLTSTGSVPRVGLRLIFSYRNVLHSIELWGSEQDVSMDFALEVANQLLGDLKQLALSDTVQFEP